MLLKASIFHLAKSPGNYCPYRERADMILMELPIKSVYVLGRYLKMKDFLQFTAVFDPSLCSIRDNEKFLGFF